MGPALPGPFFVAVLQAFVTASQQTLLHQTGGPYEKIVGHFDAFGINLLSRPI